MGIALLVQEDLRPGRLVVPFAHATDNAFWLIMRKGNPRRPAVEAFCRWLREEAAADAEPPPARSG